MTAQAFLTLAEVHLRNAEAYLANAAELGPREMGHHAGAIAARVKALAVDVHREERNIYALRASIGGVDLTESLERALGASAGEVCS